jgi:hypothetical protein
MTKRKIRIVQLLILVLSCIGGAWSQEFLQIETKNDPTTIKFGRGSVLLIKTVSEPEVYRPIQILDFDYTNQAIIYDEGRLALADIKSILQKRAEVNVFSKMLMTFGTVWLGYGLLGGQLGKNETSGYADLAIGASSVALGYGMYRAFYKRHIQIGDKYKLRLIDLRMK